MAEKILKTYYLGDRFPSISITGSACALNCRHCNRHYLTHMIPALTPEEFVEECLRLDKQGATGVLISGGCAADGTMLNLGRFFDAIKKVKKKTDLVLKLHTGMVDEETAGEIVESGVDIASVDVVGDPKPVKEIFNLDVDISKYTETLRNLREAGMRHIAPHVIAGLYFSKLLGEFNALKIVKENVKPSTVVIVVFRPTIGTELAELPAPSPEDVGKVVSKAVEMFPDTPVALGCMRPRSSRRNDVNPGLYRHELEMAALLAGATKMEIPSLKTLTAAKSMGYTIKKLYACCALPEEYERLAR